MRASPKAKTKRGPITVIEGKGVKIPIYFSPRRGEASHILAYYAEGRRKRERVSALDDAKKLLAAAEEEAARNKWEVVIAILNDGGRIVAVHRMDGARPGNDQIAIAKATTSAMTCRPSVVWEKWIEGPHKAYATFPFIAAQGGLPIIIEGDLIGAIGVSGVRASEDEQIAMAAIKAAFPQAKTARAGEENDARDF